MAYISDFLTISSATKAAASPVALATSSFPLHVTDDYLVVGITSEAEATMTIGLTGGQGGTSWTQIGSTVGSGTTATGLYSAMFYKKCVNSSESASMALSVLTAYHIHVFVVKDADTTTFLDGTPSSAYVATASQFNSASITTTVNNSLLLYYVGIDSTTTTPTMCHSAPGPIHFIESSDNGGANVTAGSKVMAGACCGWYFQKTAGVTPQPAWNASLTASTTRFTVGIRNKTNGIIPAYVDDYTTSGVDFSTMGIKLMDGHWWASATTRNNENFKATPLTVTSIITHLGTLTGTFDAGASVVDVHLNPYSAAVSTTPATSLTALTGFEVGFPTTAINMTDGWIVGTLMESTPKAANFNTGSIAQGGMFLSIGSTTNYRIFQIMAKDNLMNTEGRAIFSVQSNQTQTQSGQSVTPPTITAIDKMCVLTRGNTTTMATYCCDFHLIKKIIVAGGSSIQPVNSEGLYQVGKYLRLKLIQRLGADGLMPMVPIQIGGGDLVDFQIDAGALQFPRIYDRAKREINYHGANNAIGISYAGKTGDVIKHTNSVITSASPYYFEINTAATSACTWDFTGLVVVKANVTLRNVMTFDSMSFSSCPSISVSGCTVTNASIKGVPVTNGSLVTTSSTVLSYCNINVSTITAGNYLTILTSQSNFNNCTFVGSGTSGHAIVITTPGTYNLVGNIFTSFGASGSTSAAIYNNSGGSVIINISGGGNTPTFRNGASASTTVNNTFNLTFTGLQTNSEVRCYTGINPATAVEIGSVENSTSSFNFTHSSGGVAGYVVIHALGYQSYRSLITYASADQTIPIQQILDRQYNNPT